MKHAAAYFLRLLVAALLASPAVPRAQANGLLLGVSAAVQSTADAGTVFNGPADIPDLRAWLKSTDGVTAGSSLASQFTGANTEYLSAADSSVFPSTGSFTMAVQVYADTLSVSAGAKVNIIAGQWDYEKTKGWMLVYDTDATGATHNRFSLWVSTDGVNNQQYVWADGAAAPATGTWYYIVAKVDGANHQLSIKINNGTADTASYAGTVNNSTAAFTLGAQLQSGSPVGTQTWDGRMRCAGLWWRLTTTAEDTWLYNAGAARAYVELGNLGNDGMDLRDNLVAWWNLGESSGNRADSAPNAKTLTDNNSVTGAAGPVGGASNSPTPVVSAWVDQTANAYSFAQASAANRPALIADVKNGLPALRFDRTDYLSVASMLGLSSGTARSIVIVAKITTASDAQVALFSQGESGSGTGVYAIDANTFNGSGTKFGMRTENGFDSNLATDTDYHYWVVKHATMTSGAALIANTTYRIDGVTRTLSNINGVDQFSNMSTANLSVVGAYAHLISWYGGFDVLEVLVYGHALTTTEITNLEGYCVTRYAF